MSKVKLTTITPVHIGSGNVLHNNIDFVKGKVKGYSYLGVVDHQKLLSIIGPQRVDQWVAAIERGDSIGQFMDNCVSGASSIGDYSSRLIYCPQALNMKTNEPMREYIHDGFGRAYIPGSSLKGSIRTALLPYSIDQHRYNISGKIDYKNKKRAARKVEADLFGADPNSDCFRFLQVGDVYFNNDCEYVYDMININQRENQSFVDRSKHQLVEAVLDEDESCEFNMNLSMTTQLAEMIDEYNRKVEEWNSRNVGKKPKNKIKKLDVPDLSSLFTIVNNHTANLLSQEIEDWNKYIGQDGVQEYIDAINSLREEVDACKTGECVLRVGHASGWRFTTGAWSENLGDKEWNDLVNATRSGNQQKYSGYSFPKSRRANYCDHEILLLGFVKLRIQE